MTTRRRFLFDAARQVGDILNPHDGKPARPVWRSITISAPKAALTDALSTADCLHADRAGLDACIACLSRARLESAVPSRQ